MFSSETILLCSLFPTLAMCIDEIAAIISASISIKLQWSACIQKGKLHLAEPEKNIAYSLEIRPFFLFLSLSILQHLHFSCLYVLHCISSNRQMRNKAAAWIFHRKIRGETLNQKAIDTKNTPLHIHISAQTLKLHCDYTYDYTDALQIQCFSPLIWIESILGKVCCVHFTCQPWLILFDKFAHSIQMFFITCDQQNETCHWINEMAQRTSASQSDTNYTKHVHESGAFV